MTHRLMTFYCNHTRIIDFEATTKNFKILKIVIVYTFEKMKNLINVRSMLLRKLFCLISEYWNKLICCFIAYMLPPYQHQIQLRITSKANSLSQIYREGKKTYGQYARTRCRSALALESHRKGPKLASLKRSTYTATYTFVSAGHW